MIVIHEALEFRLEEKLLVADRVEELGAQHVVVLVLLVAVEPLLDFLKHVRFDNLNDHAVVALEVVDEIPVIDLALDVGFELLFVFV